MARMKPPTVPARPVPIVPADRLKPLFAACPDVDVESTRDDPERRKRDLVYHP
jgi:hypothetical protein